MSEQRWQVKIECMCITHDAGLPSHTCLPDPLLHLDGIPWWDAKAHWWWQRCRPQTRGFGVERCSCGAIRFEGDWMWLERKWRWR